MYNICTWSVLTSSSRRARNSTTCTEVREVRSLGSNWPSSLSPAEDHLWHSCLQGTARLSSYLTKIKTFYRVSLYSVTLFTHQDCYHIWPKQKHFMMTYILQFDTKWQNLKIKKEHKNNKFMYAYIMLIKGTYFGIMGGIPWAKNHLSHSTVSKTSFYNQVKQRCLLTNVSTTETNFYENFAMLLRTST